MVEEPDKWREERPETLFFRPGLLRLEAKHLFGVAEEESVEACQFSGALVGVELGSSDSFEVLIAEKAHESQY